MNNHIEELKAKAKAEDLSIIEVIKLMTTQELEAAIKTEMKRIGFRFLYASCVDEIEDVEKEMLEFADGWDADGGHSEFRRENSYYEINEFGIVSIAPESLERWAWDFFIEDSVEDLIGYAEEGMKEEEGKKIEH